MTPNAPVNYTGGLYAADLFLEHVIPEIEASPAFKEGGLIDVTFDEGFPPFTYTGNSFANSTIVAPDAATSIEDDSAGETLFGHRVHYEPTGSEHAAGQERQRRRAVSRPGRQRLHRPPERLRRPDGPGAAGRHLPARRRQQRAGRPHGCQSERTRGGQLDDRRQLDRGD